MLNDSPLPAPLGIPGCRLAHREELLRRRFSLSVSSPLGYGSSQTPGDVEAGLLRQGYPDGVVRSLYPRTDRGGAPIVVSAHARIWRGFGFELVSDIVPESHLLAGHSPVTFYRVRLDYTARTSAALLTARFGAARIGAGPARHKADWSSVERHIAGAPAPVDTLIGVNAWSTTQTGWMVRATYMYPLSRGVFIELAGRYSSISAARTRNTGHFDPEPVGHSGYQVALGIGVAR